MATVIRYDGSNQREITVNETPEEVAASLNETLQSSDVWVAFTGTDGKARALKAAEVHEVREV